MKHPNIYMWSSRKKIFRYKTRDKKIENINKQKNNINSDIIEVNFIAIYCSFNTIVLRIGLIICLRDFFQSLWLEFHCSTIVYFMMSMEHVIRNNTIGQE